MQSLRHGFAKRTTRIASLSCPNGEEGQILQDNAELVPYALPPNPILGVRQCRTPTGSARATNGFIVTPSLATLDVAVGLQGDW